MVGRIWRYAVSDAVPKRSVIVVLIVGTILNLINQGDAVFTAVPIDLAKLLLTYLVCIALVCIASALTAPSPIGCMRHDLFTSEPARALIR